MKIYVDSQALAIKALSNTTFLSKQVFSSHNALNQMGDRLMSLTVVWTRAHVGTRGNEEADRLAKIGTELECK